MTTPDGRRGPYVLSAIYREWLGPSEVKIEHKGRTHTVQPGDFLLYDLIRPLNEQQRRRLGSPLKGTAIRRRTGVAPEPGQLLVRASGLVAQPATIAEQRRILVIPAKPGEKPPRDVLPFVEGRCSEGQTWAGLYAAAREARVAWVVLTTAGKDAEVGWLATYFDRPPAEWEPVSPDDVMMADLYRVGSSGFERPGRPLVLPPRIEPGEPVPEGATHVLVADRDAVLDDHSMAILLEAARTHHFAVVFPLHASGDPASLPMAGSPGSCLPRLPGGLSYSDVSRLLRVQREPLQAASPEHPCAALVQANVLVGDSFDASNAPTCMEAYAWRPTEGAGPTAKLLQTRGGRATDWPVATAALRSAAGSIRPATLPVALYSHAIGPWGGVAVLFSLSHELSKLGFSATVAYHNHAEHHLRSLASPRVVQSPDALVNDPCWALGWPEPVGIVVGSHWYSGVTLARLRRHPGIVQTSILQDREDWFLDRQGTSPQLKPAQFRDYLALGEGAAVADWILDSLAEDFSSFVRENYRTIPAGVDCSMFCPPEGLPLRRSGPIRVLSMARPGTAVRRGLARLRQVYAGLRASYPLEHVSLELFGWRDATGVESMPIHDRHHGHLSPPQVAALMREVDIVVEPSDYQGFGLPGLEAMASGVCLVSTACRGVDAYAKHELTALIIPHGNLQEGVTRAIEDSDLRTRLGQAGREAALAFDWPRIGARWALYLIGLAHRKDVPEKYARGLDRIEDRARKVLEDSIPPPVGP